MKIKYIRVVSDLHLEQYQGKDVGALRIDFIPSDVRDSESVLVLAGDISSKPAQLVEFLAEVEKHFLHVVYIPGNHEFYGHIMKKWSEDLINTMMTSYLTERREPRILYATLDVGYHEFENVRFIFGTLWADGGKSLYERAMVGRSLRDFFVIKTEREKGFKVPDMMDMHARHKQQIEEFLLRPFNGTTVVVTHHMPSYRLCHPRFGGDINGGFASNCESILAGDTAPDIWIHGHTHDTIDVTYWNTRIVCNPSGYYFENDERYKQFQPKFIELES